MDQMEIERIIDQVHKLYTNNWAEIDVTQLFNAIDDKVANCKLPLYNNTIHQIARHILATELVVIKRLQGQQHTLSPKEDWVPVDLLMATQWSRTIEDLHESKNELIAQLLLKDDTELNQPVIEGSATVYDTLHGHIQHSYYHIGQIVIIKNLIEKQTYH